MTQQPVAEFDRPASPGRAPGWNTGLRTGPGRVVQRTVFSGLQFNNVIVVYAMMAVLLVGTFIAGTRGIGAIRPIFVVGCLYVTWRAWKISPGLHAEMMIYLFTLAPFLRRVVDNSAGYNPSGVMLLGALLPLLLPTTELMTIFTSRQKNFKVYMPYLVMLTCIIYGWSYGSFQDHLVEASTEAVKMLLPMLYAVYIIQRTDGSEDIMQGAARAFMIVGPVIGIYGVLQWLNPPEWDRYWMIYSKMVSIGQPEPRQIRVFSTMNSPASFATFAACGLLIFSFCRRGWLPLLLVLPIGVGLLLSAVRTAWIMVAITVVFATLFNSTRNRSVVLTISLVGAIAAALLLTPAGDVITSRMASLGSSPSQDGSAHARMQQYEYVYSNLDIYLFGSGLGNVIRNIKIEYFDGQLITSSVTMGIVMGNIHVLCIVWAAVQGLYSITLQDRPLRVVTAAMVLAFTVLLPLEAVSVGEVSFLFWLLVGVMSSSTSTKRTPAGQPSLPRPRPPGAMGLTVGR